MTLSPKISKAPQEIYSQQKISMWQICFKKKKKKTNNLWWRCSICLVDVGRRKSQRGYFASWRGNLCLFSCSGWRSACLSPAPPGCRQVPIPSLSWRWSHRTSQASCLLQSQENFTTSMQGMQGGRLVEGQADGQTDGQRVRCNNILPMLWRTTSGL